MECCALLNWSCVGCRLLLRGRIVRVGVMVTSKSTHHHWADRTAAIRTDRRLNFVMQPKWTSPQNPPDLSWTFLTINPLWKQSRLTAENEVQQSFVAESHPTYLPNKAIATAMPNIKPVESPSIVHWTQQRRRSWTKSWLCHVAMKQSNHERPIEQVCRNCGQLLLARGPLFVRESAARWLPQSPPRTMPCTAPHLNGMSSNPHLDLGRKNLVGLQYCCMKNLSAVPQSDCLRRSTGRSLRPHTFAHTRRNQLRESLWCHEHDWDAFSPT